MGTRMQQRRGSAAEFAADNPILADGEIGYDKTGKFVKIGDGETAWNDLDTLLVEYAGNAGTLQGFPAAHFLPAELLLGGLTGYKLEKASNDDFDFQWIPVGVGGAPDIAIVKSADESVVNSIVKQNDDELFFPMAAGDFWRFMLELWISGSNGASADMNWTVIGPAGMVDARIGSQGMKSDTGAASFPATQITTTTSNITTDTPGSTTQLLVVAHGWAHVGATPGDLQFQFAQRNLHAVDQAIVRKNSRLLAWKEN